MIIKEYLQKSIELKQSLLDNAAFIKNVETVVEVIKNKLEKGYKILIAGNGGSAADAQHFAAELIGRYKGERQPYSAIALTTDTSILTALGNDYDFESIFSRQIEALGNEGDIFVGISTSGNSLNIIRAIEIAKQKGMQTVALLGKDGGQAKNLADINILIPSDITSHIQEVHITLIHIFCETLE